MSMQARKRVKRRIRARQINKFRVLVTRSNRNIYAQLADPSGKVLCGISTLTPKIRKELKNGGNKEAALKVGVAFGELIKGMKLSGKLAFDRSGYIYHGRVQQIAEGLRKSKIDI